MGTGGSVLTLFRQITQVASVGRAAVTSGIFSLGEEESMDVPVPPLYTVVRACVCAFVYMRTCERVLCVTNLCERGYISAYVCVICTSVLVIRGGLMNYLFLR